MKNNQYEILEDQDELGRNYYRVEGFEGVVATFFNKKEAIALCNKLNQESDD